ncbi:MAG: NAD(P)-dependent oxidoreductase [Rhodospirillaceae bacterium]
MGEKLGMIGLGKMGLELSKQLMIDGHEMYGYDIDPERMQMLAEAGGTPMESGKAMAEICDITFSILLAPEHIEENTIGENGIIHAGKESHIHVEMSTMSPSFQIGLAQKLADRGIDMMDAPISGSHDKTAARIITFMAGGSDAAFERVRPIIEPLGRDVSHTGPVGTGATMKVITNLYVNSVTALLAEVAVVGEKAGLSHESMMHCLSMGSVRGVMFETMMPRFFNRDFAPRGAVEIYYKDMGLAIDLAKDHDIDLTVVPAAREMFKRAMDAGWSKDDASKVLEVYYGKDKA